MQDSTWYVIAMIVYLLAMAAIGYWSYKQTDQYDDYVLGGRGLHPFVAALSAGASDMSGWLLMGLPGALFLSGMSELWMAIGLLVGCWANWKWVAPRLRSYSEIAANSITVPSFFENRLHDKSRLLRIISAAIIIFFFTFYVSSGMVSGGRYFESTFQGDYLTGMLIVGSITVLYTFIGGFLAVSYTDVVQGALERHLLDRRELDAGGDPRRQRHRVEPGLPAGPSVRSGGSGQRCLRQAQWAGLLAG